MMPLLWAVTTGLQYEQYKQYYITLNETIKVLKGHKKKGDVGADEKQRVLKKWESWGKRFISEDHD